MSDTASANGPDSGTQFSADTEDLESFVKRGTVHVAQLEAIAASLQTHRRRIAAAMGDGVGPVALGAQADSRLGEAVAEASINNAFADEVRAALIDVRGLVARSPAEAVAKVDRRLRQAGLPLVGADRPRWRDRDLLHRYRAGELTSAGLPIDAVKDFVEDSVRFGAAVDLLNMGLHPDAVIEADPDRLSTVAKLRAAGGLTDFDVEQLQALVMELYPDALDRRVLAGTMDPPDDEVRDLMVAAMTAGEAPTEVGLNPLYFPAAYRDRLEGIAEPRLRYLDAVVAVADATAGSRWEGERYGSDYLGHHATTLNGGLLGLSHDRLGAARGFGPEFDHMAARLAADPDAALAFFDAAGLRSSADLATLLAGNGVEQRTIDRFGQALAGASRTTTADGRPALSFSGQELLGLDRTPTDNGVVWYSPAILFAADRPTDHRFDPEFLADATAAVLLLAEHDEQHGLHSHIGSERVNGMDLRYDGGEDPRNILLARAAQDPEATRLLLRQLNGPIGRGYSGVPGPGALDPLLRPRHALTPTIGPDPDRSWIDRLFGTTIADPDHPAIHPAAYPILTAGSPSEAEVHSPITALLGTVATQDGLSRWILRYTARSVAADGPMVQDAGTAAGLDLILAMHATAMYEPEDLAAVGIEPTGLNASRFADVGGGEWRSVHREVLRFGRGQALAAATERLLQRSISGAVDGRGRFDGPRTVPFATMAGRAEAEAYEALFQYGAELDDEAREENRRVNLAASLSFSALGAIPFASIPASAASASWVWFYDGYPTDTELRSRRDAWQDEYLEVDEVPWDRVVAIETLNALAPSNGRSTAVLELVPPGGAATTVRVRPPSREHGRRRYQWQHPRTGRWEDVPLPPDGAFRQVFPDGTDGPGVGLGFATAQSAVLVAGIRAGRQASIGGVDERPRLRSVVAFPDGELASDRYPAPTPGELQEQARWTGDWIGD